MNARKEEVHMSEETRVALLEQSIGHINETLLRMEKRFDRIDERFIALENKMDKGFGNVNEKFEKVDGKIENLRDSFSIQFRWIMGSIIGLYGSIILALLKTHTG